MDLLRPDCRILPQKPPWTTEPDRLDPGWTHSLCVPKVQGGLHEPLHYHWCRCCCAVYCGLSRVPLEERVTREICVYATTGDVHEAEGIRLCLQGVTPLWWWEAGRCMTQSCTGGETMSTQAAESSTSKRPNSMGMPRVGIINRPRLMHQKRSNPMQNIMESNRTSGLRCRCLSPYE